MEQFNKKCLLVTGATGYLGSEIVKALTELGHSVIALKRRQSSLARLSIDNVLITECFDIEDGLELLFQRHHIHGVIHCATDYGRNSHSAHDIMQTNVMLPLKILTLGLQENIEFFLNTGTLLEKGTNDYALSKYQFQEWLEKATDKTVVVNLSLEHFYGLDHDSSKFVTWIAQQTLAGARIPLTLGEQKRDFLYISDVVAAYMAVIHNMDTFTRGYHTFEVGSGQTLPIKEFLNAVSDVCAPHTAVYAYGEVLYRPNERMDSKLDISPLLRLGWKPQVSLQDGLQKLVDSLRTLKK